MGNNIDLPTLAKLNKYWRKFPPFHILMAAYVGYKEPPEETPETKDAAIEELIAFARGNH